MKESTRALDAVSQLFPSRQLRFFLTAPAPCPYLAGNRRIAIVLLREKPVLPPD